MNKAKQFLKSHKMTADDINIQELVNLFLNGYEKRARRQRKFIIDAANLY